MTLNRCMSEKKDKHRVLIFFKTTKNPLFRDVC